MCQSGRFVILNEPLMDAVRTFESSTKAEHRHSTEAEETNEPAR